MMGNDAEEMIQRIADVADPLERLHLESTIGGIHEACHNNPDVARALLVAFSFFFCDIVGQEMDKNSGEDLNLMDITATAFLFAYGDLICTVNRKVNPA